MYITVLYLVSCVCIFHTCATAQGNDTFERRLDIFEPVVVMESCSKRYLDILLYNASDTGIVFVKGQSTSCKEPTSKNVSSHTFFFDSCGITWNTDIQVIVQKHSTYQTGLDKAFSLICSADLSEIIHIHESLNLTVDDSDNGNQSITIRPSGVMMLYSKGKLINGKTVSLSEKVKMAIKLDTNYSADFDIEAKYCTAATIPVIEDFCSTDEALFPNFQKKNQGAIYTEFGAFRVTDMSGSEVEMIFTCILKVCLGNCERNKCNEGDERKRRAISQESLFGESTFSHFRHKRSTTERFNDIVVGAKVKVVSKKKVEDDDPNDDICMDLKAFVGMVAGMGAALGATMLASLLMNRKENKDKKKARKRVSSRKK